MPIRPLLSLPIPFLPIIPVYLHLSVVCLLPMEEGDFFRPSSIYPGGEGFNNGFGLPEVICSVKQGNYDLVILTETKIPDAVYCHNCLGYDVVCSEATVAKAGRTQGGGVGLVARELIEGWIIKSTRFHGPNLVRCKVISGYQKTPLIGAYLPSSIL